MKNLEPLVRENVRLLEQGRELIGALEPGLYEEPAPPLALGGVGSHLRHCLDFYASFLRDVEDASLDYDRRERDPEVETDPTCACRRIEALVELLQSLPSRAARPQDGLRVKAEDSGGADEGRWARSSIERELQFLCSHTVHHYALIAVILRYHGRDPGPEFGVAPSTLRYWEKAGACAR